jgi:hypothetical protein
MNTPATPTGNVIDIEQYRIRMKAIKLRISKANAEKTEALRVASATSRTPWSFAYMTYSVRIPKYFHTETKT